jgi:hypothetical protein
MADFDQPQFDPGDGEAQDRAETLDETNLTEDGEDIANFDEIPDVYDAVTAQGDEDDDVAEDADDLSIDDDLEDLDTTNDNDERDDEGQDIDLEPLAAHNRTSDNPEDFTMGEQPRSFEPSAQTDQAAAETDTDETKKAPPSKLSTERQLDHGLKETFPASDPVSINPGAD